MDLIIFCGASNFYVFGLGANNSINITTWLLNEAEESFVYRLLILTWLFL